MSPCPTKHDGLGMCLVRARVCFVRVSACASVCVCVCRQLGDFRRSMAETNLSEVARRVELLRATDLLGAAPAGLLYQFAEVTPPAQFPLAYPWNRSRDRRRSPTFSHGVPLSAFETAIGRKIWRFRSVGRGESANGV
jgi:hypothetical protein